MKKVAKGWEVSLCFWTVRRKQHQDFEESTNENIFFRIYYNRINLFPWGSGIEDS